MSKIKDTFREYSEELVNKVQWPSFQELQSSTITVFIASLLIAVVIFALDFVFSNGIGFLYSIFS